MLLKAGYPNITLCDRKGAIYEGRTEGIECGQRRNEQITNLDKKSGSLADMLVSADVFIGVSAPRFRYNEMVKSMTDDPIIFACANPVPEIYRMMQKQQGARIISTGRSDFPNQINNVLAFPGIFRGHLMYAKDINDEMKIAAAEALANLIF